MGRTAIALHIGHRKSIDFDLFTKKQVNKNKIIKTATDHSLEYKVKFQDGDQITGMIGPVQFTFYEYPFDIQAKVQLDEVISMPDLITLAAMKAYVLGMRVKWKDYVDLYFIFKDHFSLDEIAKKAELIFGGGFNKKLFRQQISYFKDVDYLEKIEYMGDPVSDEEVKEYLINVATTKI